MVFKFLGTKGEKEADPNTLIWLKFSRSRILTKTSIFVPFLPIEGVTIGQTTIDDLKLFGFNIGNGGTVAVNKKRPVIHFMCNEKSTIVERIKIPSSSIPVEWPEAKELGQMTYKKWLSYFEKYGFDIHKNEALEPSVYMFPQLIAIQPQIGLKVTVTFMNGFNVKSKANKSEAIGEWEITLI